MPKIGSRYEIPTKDLDDCIQYLEVAYSKEKEFSIRRESFARAIGMNPTGGGFGLVAGSLSIYGLVSTGDSYIRYTDIAQKILFGNDKEKLDFKNRAVRNVRLFAELFERYGYDPAEDQLRHFLRERAEVAISQEAKIAKEVGKLFKKNAKHLKSFGGEKTMVSSAVTQESMGDVLFTVTAPNLRIDVDSPLKITLVEAMVEDAKKRFIVKKEPVGDNGNSTEGREDV